MLPAYAGMIPAQVEEPHPLAQVLPAYAGMIPASTRTVRIGVGAPRVCGDDPTRAPRR